MTRLLVGGTDQVQLPADSSGKRAGFVKTAIGGSGTEIYIPANVLTDDAGNTLDSANANLTVTGTERGLVVRPAGMPYARITDGTNIAAVSSGGGISVRGTFVTGQSTAVTANTPVNTTALDVSAAGNMTIYVKNTVAGTPFTGTPVINWEQSDDATSWAALPMISSALGPPTVTASITPPAANGSIAFDCGLEGVNYVRARVSTAQTANGMTIVIVPGGGFFSPVVGVQGLVTVATSASSLSSNAPPTTTGWSVTKLISLATTNAGFSKNGTGTVGGWYVFNANAATRYLKLYAKGSAPTVGTDVPQMTIPIPAGGAANVEFNNGVLFSSGVAYAMTTGSADTDTGAVAAGDIIMNLLWK